MIEWGDDNQYSQEFWKLMGIESGVQPESLPDTSEYKQKQAQQQQMFAEHVNKMYHVTNEEGAMSTKLVQEGKLDRAILKEEADDVLIIDVGRVIFVWIGKTANKQEKREAMKMANQYIVESKRPNWTPVTRVFDGREPASFWKAFGCTVVPEDIC